VLYLLLIIFSVGVDVSIDSETLLMTDFVDLKIKPTQFFRGAHRVRMCVRVFIGVDAHMYISIYICNIFFKKITLLDSNRKTTKTTDARPGW
jgi:hypothetical protein